MELPCVWLGIHLLKVHPRVLREFSRNLGEFGKQWYGLGPLLIAPLIVVLALSFTEETFDPGFCILGHLVLWLARLRGYSGLYYHEYIPLAVSEWLAAGIFLPLTIGFLLLHKEVKKYEALKDK